MFTKIFKLTMLFLAVIVVSGSSQALAAKPGTIMAKRCSSGAIVAEIAGILVTSKNAGYFINGFASKSRLYKPQTFQTSIRRGTVFWFYKVPKKIKPRSRISVVTKRRTYTATFKQAVLNGRGMKLGSPFC